MRWIMSAGIIALTVSHLAAQGASSSLSSQAATQPPEAGRRAILLARADQAIAELQTTLLARLKEELGKGGARAAVSVCRDEAQRLTASIGAKHQLQIGRTSDRVRNPANAPRPWTSAHVAAFAGKPLVDAAPTVVDLGGGGLGVLRPIGTADFCVACHGQREAVQSAIGPVLAAAYPNDRAVGFAPGDLRGWFWVEVR